MIPGMTAMPSINPSSTATSGAEFSGTIAQRSASGSGEGNRGYVNNVAFSGSTQSINEPVGLKNYVPWIVGGALALVGLIVLKKYGSR
jgi:hypothetical protein